MKQIFEALNLIDVEMPADKYLRETLRVICEHMGFDSGAVFEYLEDGPAMVADFKAPYSLGIVEFHEGGFRLCPCCQRAVDDHAISVFAGPEFGGLRGEIAGELRGMGMNTFVCVPVLSGGIPLGCFVLYARGAVSISHNDKDFFNGISLFVSLALTAGKRLGQLAEKADRLEAEAAVRVATEKKLVEEKEKLMVMLGSIGDGVIAVGTDLRVILMNSKAEKLTGWDASSAVGRDVREVFDIVDAASRKKCENPLEKTLRTGENTGLVHNTMIVSRNGDEKYLSASSAPFSDNAGSPAGAILVFRDITDRKIMEEELLKASKLESIGVLAGGIAHDFNNLLTGIIGNISYAKLLLPAGNQAMEVLTKAEEVAFRAKDLTSQFRTFSKGGVPVKKTMFLHDLLVSSFEFATRGSKVMCEFSISDDLYPVEVDEGQINQVMTNLALNAIEAMPGNGTIRVVAENMFVERGFPIPVRAGRYVRISVSDSGHGIIPENIPRIFDPYFTTKSRGSGLGLTASYSIVRKHDGAITVESEPGRGATFRIYLPVSSKETARSVQGAQAASMPARHRIMIMDDEAIVREVSSQLLTHLGYEVFTAASGAEAIAAYENALSSGIRFDAVILDLVLPGGPGGAEVLRRLLELDEKTCAIVSSGYSNEQVMDEFFNYGFKGIVSKPYRIKELDETIRRVIASSSEGGMA